VSFVNEVEKVGKDPVYFVRREATFVLGALAKVVPDELVLGSLASELLSRMGSALNLEFSYLCLRIFAMTPCGMFGTRHSLLFRRYSRV
jgi:hypothetical protein